MSTVGQHLQEIRRERKHSLADVSQHTKIQPWVLEAIEADRLQELMSPVYVKGFLTTYAKFLHLAPEPLLGQMTWPAPEVSPQGTTVLPPARPAIPAMAWASLWPHLSWRRIAVAAAVGGLVVLFMTGKPTAWMARVARLPIGHVKSASVTVSEKSAVLELPTLALLAAQPLELVVSAQRTTWIQVRADGKLLTQQRIPRGANERWTAKRQLELIIAKPSQVELELNGQSISPFAITHRGRLLITHRGVTRLPDDVR